MRTEDLLALLADYPKNTVMRVRLNADYNIEGIRLQTDPHTEQKQLIIVPKAKGNPIKSWELALQLNKPELFGRYVYTYEKKNSDVIRPVFGVQDVKGVLVIN